MKSLFVILSSLFFQFSHAQEISRPEFRFGINLGMGLYNQSDLENLNKEVKKTLPFEVETFNNFPPRAFVGGYLMVQIGSSLSIGPIFQYHSTGSRIGLKDYSGSYSFDQIISSNMFGWRTEVLLNKSASTKIIFHFDAGIDVATWRIKEVLMLGQVEEKYEDAFVGVCPYIEPSLGLRWHLSRLVSLSVKPAFHIDLGGKYHLKNNRDATAEQKPSWNGPRISINLDYKSKW